jgi:diguanylate cyclase (GGDEF)-like protein
MSTAELPDPEFTRLVALARYSVLDTLPEERFDRLTSMVSEVLQVPLAFINFVDQFRVWGKSCVGLPENEGPRDTAFCAWTVLQHGQMIVPDLRLDPRFSDHPLVIGEMQLRFYAGAPLITPDGHAIGTLCVMDRSVRVFSDREQRLLGQFAALVMDALELRVREQGLEREIDARASQVQDLKRVAVHAETLSAITSLFDSGLDPAEATQASVELLCHAADVDWAGLLRLQGGALTLTAQWNSQGAFPELLPSDLSAYRRGVSALLIAHQVGQFIDDYPASPRAMPQIVDWGVTSLALVPLGEYDGAQYALVGTRMHRSRTWRASDRSLLEAAARTVRGSLERLSRMEAAQAAAQTDSLTGLLNRRAFDRHLGELKCGGESFQAVVIDLDGMKSVNDAEGHERGDTLITLFGQALRTQFRSSDRIYRLGGDEYALLMAGSTQLLDEEDVLERIDLAVVIVRAAGFSRVGASTGVALSEEHGAAEVIAAADTRMYEQKRRRAKIRSAQDTVAVRLGVGQGRSAHPGPVEAT